jgi:hypothetical protein
MQVIAHDTGLSSLSGISKNSPQHVLLISIGAMGTFPFQTSLVGFKSCAVLPVVEGSHKVDAVRTGITQIVKLALAIMTWMSHILLSIPRILIQPFVVSFGISTKIVFPNFDTHCMPQDKTLESIFFVDVFK